MMEYNKAVIGRIAKENGFVRDTFEKVLRLKNVLKFINEHEYLKEHLALKGGTAINMTIFNLPRLSVDIDLDYIPNSDKTEMEYAREKISEIIKEYMAEEGYTLSPSSRFSHSLDAFYYQYQNAGGNKDVLKIEINYSLRAHVFGPIKRKVLSDIFDDELEVLTLAPMEIFAAKANALMSRAAARDLYDFNNMTFLGLFDESEEDMFRKCIVFYNTISQETVNKSFDTSAIDKLTFAKIRRDLFPVIKKKEHFDLDARKQNAKEYIHDLMQLTEQELQYMTEFENKNYKPELLFDDKEILERIKNHPMAVWKCQK
ncbi:nucleotidyl transferase AbiEii/AbiGii toxin family protein [Zhenpiania hominis]|uniref:Nucleotidyl transferase AbiEii/AbiGii toxin family protein n=1 Tax=Zhenpiania hominis TaxID=2763644 RepID=A0A923NQM2_9FIRM|nr:nucleotidyl transferase AbiEii/AbiGii toxin family protein [Zhenpiania hominis]MBC6680885.1 nucleotidyl transferase AbiEii/AbiGii toxin family protein [Zhenpiania hominis]